MTILFYPDNIKHHSKIRYLLDHLKINTTNDPADEWDVAIFWDYNTTRLLPAELIGEKPVINAGCLTADKEHVDTVFRKLFNYTTLVNPLKHRGFFVKKSIEQAVHDGEIISGPVDREPGFIYQKLLDSRCQVDQLCDIRVPVIDECIPLVWLKFRSLDNTFGNQHGQISRVRLIENVEDVFSQSEQLDIIDFCQRYPVDYCELDIIRNNADDRLYIIDMNNTPGDSLMFHMTKSEYNKTIELMSASLLNYLNSLIK